MHLVGVKEFKVIERLSSGRGRADKHRDQLIPLSLHGSFGLDDRERVAFLDLVGPPSDRGVQQFLVKNQGLRTTFPWVFWGFHEKYKIFI